MPRFEAKEPGKRYGAQGDRIARSAQENNSILIQVREFLRRKKSDGHWDDENGEKTLNELAKEKSSKELEGLPEKKKKNPSPYQEAIDLIKSETIPRAGACGVWAGYSVKRAEELWNEYKKVRNTPNYARLSHEDAIQAFISEWYGPLKGEKGKLSNEQRTNRKEYPTPYSTIEMLLQAEDDSPVARDTPAEPQPPGVSNKAAAAATKRSFSERLQLFVIKVYDELQKKEPGATIPPLDDDYLNRLFQVILIDLTKTHRIAQFADRYGVSFEPEEIEGKEGKDITKTYNECVTPLAQSSWRLYERQDGERETKVFERFKTDFQEYGRYGFTKTSLDAIKIDEDETPPETGDDEIVAASDELVKEWSAQEQEEEPLDAAHVEKALTEAYQKPQDYPVLDRIKARLGRLNPKGARALAKPVTGALVERDRGRIKRDFQGTLGRAGNFITGLDVRRFFVRQRDPEDPKGYRKTGNIKEAIDQSEEEVRKERPDWFVDLPAKTPVDENPRMSRVDRMFAHLKLVYEQNKAQELFGDKEAREGFEKVYEDPATYVCFEDDTTLRPHDLDQDFAQYLVEATQRINNTWTGFLQRETQGVGRELTAEEFYARLEAFRKSLLDKKNPDGYAKQGYTAGPINKWHAHTTLAAHKKYGEPPKPSKPPDTPDNGDEGKGDPRNKKGFTGPFGRLFGVRGYYIRTWWVFDSEDDVKKLAEGPNNYPRQKGNIKPHYENIGEGYRPEFDQRWEDYMRKGKVDAQFLAGFKLTYPCMCDQDHAIHAHDFRDVGINPPPYKEGQIIGLGIARLSPFDWRTYEMRAQPFTPGIAGRILSYNMERLVWKWAWQPRKIAEKEKEEDEHKKIKGRVIIEQLAEKAFAAPNATAQQLNDEPGIGKTNVTVELITMQQAAGGKFAPVPEIKPLICHVDEQGRFAQSAPPGTYVIETKIDGASFYHLLQPWGRPLNTPIQHTDRDDYEYAIIPVKEKEKHAKLEGRIVDWEKLEQAYPNPGKDTPPATEIADSSQDWGLDGAKVFAVYIPLADLKSGESARVALNTALDTATSRGNATYPKKQIGITKDGGFFSGTVDLFHDHAILVVSTLDKHEANYHLFTALNPFGRPHHILETNFNPIIVPLRAKEEAPKKPVFWIRRQDDTEKVCKQVITPEQNTCNLPFKSLANWGKHVRLKLTITALNEKEEAQNILTVQHTKDLFDIQFLHIVWRDARDKATDINEVMDGKYTYLRRNREAFKLELHIKPDVEYAPLYKIRLDGELLDEAGSVIGRAEEKYNNYILDLNPSKKPIQIESSEKAEKHLKQLTIKIHEAHDFLPRVKKVLEGTRTTIQRLTTAQENKAVFEEGRDVEQYIAYVSSILPDLSLLHQLNKDKKLNKWGVVIDEKKALVSDRIERVLGRIPLPSTYPQEEKQKMAYRLFKQAMDAEPENDPRWGGAMHLADFLVQHQMRRGGLIVNMKTLIQEFNTHMQNVMGYHNALTNIKNELNAIKKQLHKKDIRQVVTKTRELHAQVSTILPEYARTLTELTETLREFAAVETIIAAIMKSKKENDLKQLLDRVKDAAEKEELIRRILGEEAQGAEPSNA